MSGLQPADGGAGARGQVRPAARASTSASRAASSGSTATRACCSRRARSSRSSPLIHEHRAEQQRRAARAARVSALSRAASPRRYDRQRHVQFRYWRCPAEHGRLTTFVEFLREKDFVRPLAPAELAELQGARARRCAATAAAPPSISSRARRARYCRSPVSTLDPAARRARRARAPRRRGEAPDRRPDARRRASRWIASRSIASSSGIERESGRQRRCPARDSVSSAPASPPSSACSAATSGFPPHASRRLRFSPALVPCAARVRDSKGMSSHRRQ